MAGLASSIPKVRVKRLRGTYERDHRGPVERPRAIAEIETVAELTRFRSIQRASIPARERRG